MINEGKKSRGQDDKLLRVIARSVSDAAIPNNSTFTPHPSPQPYGTQSHSAHKFTGSTSVPQGAREQSYEIPKQVRNDMKSKFLVPQCPSILVPLKKAAFTLAEVLITLGIIGVVAAMTLPALINNIDKKENLKMFKKAYNELSQVKQMLDFEYGGSFTMACNTFDDECLRDLFAQKMKVIKSCKATAPNDCQEKSYYSDGNVLHKNVNINGSWPMFITNSGYSVKFRFHFPDCALYQESFKDEDGNLIPLQTCGWMQIDTNGKKRPNVQGKDIFFINIYKDKLVPFEDNSELDTIISEW